MNFFIQSSLEADHILWCDWLLVQSENHPQATAGNSYLGSKACVTRDQSSTYPGHFYSPVGYGVSEQYQL